MPERELTAEDCEAILAHECDEPRGLESSDLYDDRPAEEPKCECGHDRAMHRRTDHGYICGCLTYRPPTTEPASEGKWDSVRKGGNGRTESVGGEGMKYERYLLGAGLGNVVGGLVGVTILPLGWYTVLCAVVALVGAYIAQVTWNKFYR